MRCTTQIRDLKRSPGLSQLFPLLLCVIPTHQRAALTGLHFLCWSCIILSYASSPIFSDIYFHFVLASYFSTFGTGKTEFFYVVFHFLYLKWQKSPFFSASGPQVFSPSLRIPSIISGSFDLVWIVFATEKEGKTWLTTERARWLGQLAPQGQVRQCEMAESVFKTIDFPKWLLVLENNSFFFFYL